MHLMQFSHEVLSFFPGFSLTLTDCNFFHDGDGFSVGVVVSGSDGAGGEIKQGFPKGQSMTQCLAVCNRYSLYLFIFGERLFTAAGSVKLLHFLFVANFNIKTPVHCLSFGDQKGLGFGAGIGSLNDMAALFDDNGTETDFDQDEGDSPLTAEAVVDLEMEAALEIMKSIAEAARDNTVNSLFGETYYDDF